VEDELGHNRTLQEELMQLGFYGRVFVQSPSAFDRFLSNLRAAKLYENWRKANPGESARFDTYLTGPADASVPSMLTAFGRAIVAVVEMEKQP
jgi:hypothetical protein